MEKYVLGQVACTLKCLKKAVVEWLESWSE